MFQVNSFPRCYPPTNAPNAQCYTIMYAPYNNLTELLVSRVAAANGVPSQELISFATPDAMDDCIITWVQEGNTFSWFYIDILANPNVTQAGYKFLSYENGTYEYSIIYNQTIICIPGVTACTYTKYLLLYVLTLLRLQNHCRGYCITHECIYGQGDYKISARAWRFGITASTIN